MFTSQRSSLPNGQHDKGMDEINEVKVMGYVTKEKHMSERVISIDGVAFTIMAMTHGYGQGFIYEDDTSAKSNG